MSKFRKKPVVIEAHQFVESDKSTHEQVCFGYPKAEGDTTPHRMDGKYWVPTLEGEHIVTDGDWIITGIKDEIYPCKPDIFAATYDPA